MREHELRVVADLSTAFHFCADGPEAAAWLSPSFFTLTGAVTPPPPSWHWTEVIDGADRAQFMERWREAARLHAVLDTEVRFTLRDGRRRWLRVRAVEAARPSGPGATQFWVGACVDAVPPDDGMELHDRRLKGEFLAAASHELRTPLNAAAGWLHVLKLRSRGDLEQLHALAAVDRNIAAEKTLIDGLLDAARLERGLVTLSPTVADLGMLLRQAVSGVAVSAAAHDVIVSIDVPPGPVFVAVDVPKLQRIVWHLLTNAITFSGRPGDVRVSLSLGEGDVHLRVQDDGEGIDPAVLPHLFEPFGRRRHTTSARSGLGLGLTVVRSLVELHGGAVSASSEGPGRGAVFDVILPRRS